MIGLEKLEGFTLFLFLHMARVDGSLHPNERDTIVEKMNELFPSHPLDESGLEEMEEQYARLKYGAPEAILQEGLQRFSSEDAIKRKEIYTALFDIINANGRVNEEEKLTLQIFKPWFAG
jgi:uncharacterized tellurite resistance protein B-like protein